VETSFEISSHPKKKSKKKSKLFGNFKSISYLCNKKVGNGADLKKSKVMKNKLIAQIKNALNEQFENCVTMAELEAPASPAIPSNSSFVELVEVLNENDVCVAVYDINSSDCNSLEEYNISYEELPIETLAEIAELLEIELEIQK
jgi:hypothetical protein